MKKILLSVMAFVCVTLVGAQTYPAQFENIEGFTLQGEKQFFDRDNLYNYINGASDFYLGYDFQDLWVADYTNDQEQSLTLELYRHGDNMYAFGIYSEERPQAANLLEIGAEGFYESGAVFFLAGSYYVKVYNGHPALDEDSLVDFAKQVAGKVCEKCLLPEQLSYFPAENKIPSSERYMAENFMGVTGFNGAFTAKYKIGDEECRLFVYKGDDERCREIMSKYFTRLKFKKKLKEITYVFDDPYLDKVKLTYKKGFIYGMLDCKEPEKVKGLYDGFVSQNK
ncbi:DUF6599 family protein [Carboxylicivirga caseinilyticus]|uniref:DUF6599 family protein n=1 Tax=Carboxylicivirga caseinilyticus TaxID=3417572 RepID=UPI003D3566D3|nr:hypothetical protein [Marinilabiliaceae bacterium A049]